MFAHLMWLQASEGICMASYFHYIRHEVLMTAELQERGAPTGTEPMQIFDISCLGILLQLCPAQLSVMSAAEATHGMTKQCIS